MNNSHSVEKMVITALMAALTTVVTIVIAIPVPFTNGYIHFGDSVIFLAVFILDWKRAAAAAGVGSALADLLLGYAFWAPWTLIIKGAMALIAAKVIEAGKETRRNRLLVCVTLAALWVVFNITVQVVVNYVAANDQAGLRHAIETGASDFGVMMINMQRQLMAFALLVPAGLAAASIVLDKREHITVPLCNILGLTGGGLFMVFGYYIAGGVIIGNFAVAAFSIPSNIIQFIIGFFIAVILEAALRKTPAYSFFLRLK